MIVIILQIIRYVLLFSIAVFMSLIGIIFAPVIVLFVDSKGNLPIYLKWFETPDATMFDVQWVAEHPTWSFYRIATTWSMRNPAYGFLQFIGVSNWLPMQHYGNLATDSSQSLGAFLFIGNDGSFDFTAVWKFPIVSWCVIHSFGWNIKATGKTAGAYILALIRFYNYTGK